MKTLKLMLLFAGMTFLAVPVAKAQQAKVVSDKDGWRKIAETTVDFEKDKDVLMVFGKDRFSKLQFMAMDAPIEITTMVVHYEGGTSDTITVDSRIEEGGRSRVIDLMGDKPEIGRIVLNYKTSNENWQSGTTTTTGARNASVTTRKADGTMDTKTTVTTGTGTENETTTNTRVATDNHGNATTITGTDNRKTTETEVTVDKPARNTSTTTTTTKGEDLNKPGTQSATQNTSKAAGESKLNRSTKARLILWGMQ